MVTNGKMKGKMNESLQGIIPRHIPSNMPNNLLYNMNNQINPNNNILPEEIFTKSTTKFRRIKDKKIKDILKNYKTKNKPNKKQLTKNNNNSNDFDKEDTSDILLHLSPIEKPNNDAPNKNNKNCDISLSMSDSEYPEEKNDISFSRLYDKDVKSNFGQRRKLEMVKIFTEKGYYFPYRQKDFTYEFCLDVMKGKKKVHT